MTDINDLVIEHWQGYNLSTYGKDMMANVSAMPQCVPLDQFYRFRYDMFQNGIQAAEQAFLAGLLIGLLVMYLYTRKPDSQVDRFIEWIRGKF